MARPRSQGCQWYEHRRTLARSVWRSIRLPQRTRKQLNHAVPPWIDERNWWSCRCRAFDLDTVAYVCTAGTFSDSVCDGPVHVAGHDHSSPPPSFDRSKSHYLVVDWRYRLPVFLSDVWWIFRCGEWNSDAGGDGSTGNERSASSERHQEFPWYLH